MRRNLRPHLLLLSALLAGAFAALAQNSQPATPQASYVDASHSTLRLEVDGKQYLVDVAAGTVHPANSTIPGAELFAQRCAGCHGTDGRGIASVGTPNFTNPGLQSKLTDEQISSTIHNGKSG